MSSLRLIPCVLRRRHTALLPLCAAEKTPVRGFARLTQSFHQSCTCRARYVKQVGHINWSGALLRDPSRLDLKRFWQVETRREILRERLDELAVYNLLRAILWRFGHSEGGWTVDSLYQQFDNYARWAVKPDSVSLRFQTPARYVVDHRRESLSAAHLDTLSPGRSRSNIGRALTILGKQNLRIALLDYDLHGIVYPSALTAAILLLELAMRYENVQAAVLLVKIAEDQAIIKRAKKECDRLGAPYPKPNVARAHDLLKQAVEQNPEECDWQVIVSYIREEYRGDLINRQSPRNMEWTMKLLYHAIHQIGTGSEGSKWSSRITSLTLDVEESLDGDQEEMSEKYLSVLQCENPWRVLHRVATHCLRYDIALPKYSRLALERTREECLDELVKYNDPNASLTFAVREPRVGVPEWENMVKCAAAGGIADANWLLAGIHVLKDGVFHTRTESELPLFVMHAETAILLHLNKMTTAGRPPPRSNGILLSRILAYTALLKEVAGEKTGQRYMDELVEQACNTSGVGVQTKNKLQEFLSDYTNFIEGRVDEDSTWSSKGCRELIGKVFSIQETCNQAKESEDFWDRRR